MGTTVLHKAKGTTTADFFAAEFGAEYAKAVIGTATTSSAFYAVLEVDAEQNTSLVPDENGKVRYAYVIRTGGGDGRGYFNFSYKVQTEFSGPLETQCPARLLDRLSPFKDDANGDSDGWARNWREACRKRIQVMQALKTVGVTVKLPNAVQFTDKVSEDTFILASRKGTTLRFLRSGDRRLVRLSAYQIDNLEIAA